MGPLVISCSRAVDLTDLQQGGELISKAVDAAADGLTYSWRAACDAFDIVTRSVPTRRI